mgnify:CR=1 FL=1
MSPRTVDCGEAGRCRQTVRRPNRSTAAYTRRSPHNAARYEELGGHEGARSLERDIPLRVKRLGSALAQRPNSGFWRGTGALPGAPRQHRSISWHSYAHRTQPRREYTPKDTRISRPAFVQPTSKLACENAGQLLSLVNEESPRDELAALLPRKRVKNARLLDRSTNWA